MKNISPRVLVVATSRKTRGGITSVVKAHETGNQWKKNHCKWIETHRDGNSILKIWYLIKSLIHYIALLPFYDLVHIHVGLGISVKRKIYFARIAKLNKKKIIIHFHPSTEKHLFDSNFKEQINKLFNYSDVLIVLSNQWIDWINEAYPENSYNFKVLYNPCPNVVRDFSKREKNILYTGTLIDRKGYNRLIMAFSKIAHLHPAWKLIFAGNGEVDKGKQLAKELKIETQTEFLGWITGERKIQVLQQASIYCLPSWGEGFPMGVLDAIAYGIPIVTTPVGGIPDLIRDGENGLIFNPYDVEKLAEILSNLMKFEEKRHELVIEADKLLLTELNLDCINIKLSFIYDEIRNFTK
jgi:glycosyltransferase involved in cell wall biosynthesis